MSKNLPAHQRYDTDRKNREASLQQLKDRHWKDMEETHTFAPDIRPEAERIRSKSRGNSNADESLANETSHNRSSSLQRRITRA